MNCWRIINQMRSAVLLTLPFLIAMSGLQSCSRGTPAAQFPAVADEFVNKTLEFSPVTASAQGLHKLNGHDFDRELDDFSNGSLDRQRQFYSDFHKRLVSFGKGSLSPEDQADYDIMDAQCGLALFDLDIAATARHSPQTYVELLGSALFNPMVLEYAPKAGRFEHIIARLNQVPEFLNTARRRLDGVPAVWAQVAREENDGNIALITVTLAAQVPATLKPAFDDASSRAVDALRSFGRFLAEDLPRRKRGPEPDWRLGPDKYPIKFKLALATTSTPDQVLADAEKRLNEVRAEMLKIAQPLHDARFAGHGAHAELNGSERENRVVKEVLDHIADQHSTPAGYLDDARKDLDQARSFAKENKLLTVPENRNLQVIATPEFMRGIYGVGGFNPAPVLEPQLGAFFWITPIPADWPKTRVESKLREYNVFNLQLLTIHEAMPGHSVQFEFANAVQPRSRRVLRALFGNGPYVEGWAQYITQVMLDQGYLNHSPELWLTLLKQELRVDANAIIDIRMQTNRMTDAEAMSLMELTTFQEHEEAVAKLQRVKLSSTQLPMYFLGWRDWLRVRALDSGSSLQAFHDRALREGAVPLPVLARLLTGKELH